MLERTHELAWTCLDLLISLYSGAALGVDAIGEMAAKELTSLFLLWEEWATNPLIDYTPWRARRIEPVERCGLVEPSAHELARTLVGTAVMKIGERLFPDYQASRLDDPPPVPDNDPAELAFLPVELLQPPLWPIDDLVWTRWALDLEHSAVVSASAPSRPDSEARDEWIYRQVIAGLAYKAILRELRRHPEWDGLESIEGVRRAARRYADHHRLPRPPSRHPGRPRKYQLDG